MNSRFVIIASLIIGIFSSAALAVLVYYEPPTIFFSALALLLIVLAVTGLSGPVWGAALRRMTSKKDGRTVVMMGIRFGLWSGIFIASLFLLKMLHFMDRVLILAILALLIMIEMFLQQNAARKRPSRKSRR